MNPVDWVLAVSLGFVLAVWLCDQQQHIVLNDSVLIECTGRNDGQ